MSVINQMLKDLEGREADKSQHTSTAVVANKAGRSNTKVIIISVVILVMLNILGLYFWSLYQENQTLKSQQKTLQPIMAAKPSDEALLSEKKLSEKKLLDYAEQQPPEKAMSAIVETTQTKIIKVTSQAETTKNNNLAVDNQQIIDAESLAVVPASKLAAASKKTVEQVLDKPLVNVEKFGLTKIEEPEQEQKATFVHQHQANQPHLPHKVKENTQISSSLTISRKQLSPNELAQQKMQKVERAIANNKIQQAERLLEEVLVLTPKNDEARKQLAALWYGRKAYQPALNLLQQGIALNKNNTEFRMMKARIYLTVGQVQPAYDVLHVLNKVKDIEYQALLANAAQQLKNYTAAAQAYLTLVQLAPQNGKYWLGLAIAYDSNSQFTDAIGAYQSALQQSGLSSNARNFAEQRIEELGE